MRSQVDPTQRHGMTIIELMVAAGIIGILLAILVPAVQHSRHTADRIRCQNNLKQFGLALNAHLDTHKAYPTSSVPESTYRRMLPFLDQSALLHQIHQSENGGSLPETYFVGVFGCPSDPIVLANMRHFGDSSYYLNSGTEFHFLSKTNGFRKSRKFDTRPSDVVDGTSNTVAMSERLVRDIANPNGNDQRRHFWWTEQRFRLSGEEEAAINQCQNHRLTSEPQPFGVNAFQLNASTTYDHMLTPNHHGCFNGPEDFAIDFELMLIPASSNHSGGVNTLLVDGSVHFVSETIDHGVWQQLGTRNGGESIQYGF